MNVMKNRIPKKEFVFEHIKKQDGLSLMEIIIAVVLLTIVVLGAVNGMRYINYTMRSSEEFIEETYLTQEGFENGLSYVNTLQVNDVAAITGDSHTSSITSNHNIDFDWISNKGTLSDFDAIGHVLERDVEGGEYLDETLYFYIPVVTVDE